MITLNIDNLLHIKGKSRYWLAKQCDMSQDNMKKICEGKTNSIQFEKLEKICHALECTPNDIIIAEDPQVSKLISYATMANNSYKQDDTK